MNKITLTKQQIEMLETGSKVKTKEGYTWYYIPYWYKSTNEQGVYEEYSFQELPEGMKTYLNNLKEKK